MSNAPGGAVRVGSVIVEAGPGGMRIGRFIEQARGEPGYDEHLAARSPDPMATAPPATASILRGLLAVADNMDGRWDGCATIDGHPIGPKDVRASLAWIKAALAGSR